MSRVENQYNEVLSNCFEAIQTNPVNNYKLKVFIW